MLEARDPTLATMVHDIRNYAVDDMRFGMRYTDFGDRQETGLDGGGRRTEIARDTPGTCCDVVLHHHLLELSNRRSRSMFARKGVS